MRIIYIHGFNSGKGQKARELEKQGFEVHCPQLTTNVHDDINMLMNLADKLKDKDLHIVGCSLGGYYALIILARLFSKNTVHFHFINPSLVPWKTINKYLNKKIKNYKTGEIYQLTTYFLDSLKEYVIDLESITSNQFSNSTFYFGNKDEIIDHTSTKEWIQTCEHSCNVIETNQDHRFENISTVINEIKELEIANNIKL